MFFEPRCPATAPERDPFPYTLGQWAHRRRSAYHQRTPRHDIPATITADINVRPRARTQVIESPVRQILALAIPTGTLHRSGLERIGDSAEELLSVNPLMAVGAGTGAGRKGRREDVVVRPPW